MYFVSTMVYATVIHVLLLVHSGVGDNGATVTSYWYTGLTDYWIVRLVLNIVGYSSIFIPAAILIRYLRKIQYNEHSGPGTIPDIIRLCVFGQESEKQSLEQGSTQATQTKEKTFTQSALTLLFCFVGLQLSFLTWGVLQERIMKHNYGTGKEHIGEKFRNSQFLVFVNRVLAFILACVVIGVTRQARHTAPLYKYSYCSLSNIMSSWFQYEALKYVSFPTQVLGKACKIIPVMLMGKIVSRKTYPYHEYFTATLISIGVSMFLLSSGKGDKLHSTITTFSGLILMTGYMFFDSFTSNWQGALFSKHKMSSLQMMAGVNLFSVLLTSISLIEQGTMFTSIEFMLQYPTFMWHLLLLSICSATGQLFIYYCISQFGPVTFTIIMTVRQAIAILLSCFIYHHTVTLFGVFGIVVVFLALFVRIYANKRERDVKKKQAVRSSDLADVVTKA